MLRSRRDFFGFAAAGAAVLAAGAPARARQGDASQSGPETHDPFDRTLPGGSGPQPNPRDLLEANQKSINKDVARLSEIVQEMQKQLEDKDTKDVLPLDVLRDTDEIEKLAKHIRTLVRG
jgi:hypothetical protein